MIRRILVLAANPKNTPRLRLDQEVREIDDGLQRAQRREDFIVKQQWAARPIDVRRAVLDFKPNIVHFCGHGEGIEGIAFEDENGNAKLIGNDALAGFFELFAEEVECVILNACYSDVQAEAIAQHINYVIGMRKGIGDLAALEFAVAFYDALGAGQSIEFAYKLACNAIQWTQMPEHLTPVLKSKEKIKGARIKLKDEAYFPPISSFWDEPSQKKSSKPEAAPGHPGDYKPIAMSGRVAFDLQSIEIVDTIGRTAYSIIQRCSIQGEDLVVKRTQRDLCQEQVLIKLVSEGPLIGNQSKSGLSSLRMSVAAPIAVWVTDEYVWELYPFYKGIRLDKMIKYNRYKPRGAYLGIFYNAMLGVTKSLHRLGILHRDINPLNILMVGPLDYVLLDLSFCCEMNSAQVPIGNSRYSAPEQLLGLASIQSEWYSIASTIFFMANGEPPFQGDAEALSQGIANVALGPFYSGYHSQEELFQALLNKDLSARPKNFSEIELEEGSHPPYWEVLGVLDCGNSEYLLFTYECFFSVTREELITFVVSGKFPPNDDENKSFLQEQVFLGNIEITKNILQLLQP